MADGILGVSILLLTLRKLGATVDYVIPNRLIGNYGLNNEKVDEAIEKGAEFIITVDNGISCREAIEYAKSKRLDVIITDHHLPQEDTVPKNVLIVDPSYNNDTFTGISGATVALKLAIELLSDIKQYERYFIEDLGIMAAITVISDMMPMLGENRLLVKAALKHIDYLKAKNIWAGRGLKLINGLGGYYFIKDANKLASCDLFAFYISPTINAISRVSGDVSELVDEILKLDTPGCYISSNIGKTNSERKNRAKEVLSQHEPNDRKINVEIFHEDEYPIKGLIGLAANKIATSENKPALIGIEEDDEYRFSGRSIPGYSLFEAIERIKPLVDFKIGGGGHAQAMGVSIPANTEYLKKFISLLEDDFENNYKGKESNFYELEDSTIADVVSTYERFYTFGQDFRALKMIYTGEVKDYNSEERTAIIGDYIFRTNSYFKIPSGTIIDVEFCVKIDEIKGTYFTVERITPIGDKENDYIERIKN